MYKKTNINIIAFNNNELYLDNIFDINKLLQNKLKLHKLKQKLS